MATLMEDSAELQEILVGLCDHEGSQAATEVFREFSLKRIDASVAHPIHRILGKASFILASLNNETAEEEDPASSESQSAVSGQEYIVNVGSQPSHDDICQLLCRKQANVFSTNQLLESSPLGITNGSPVTVDDARYLLSLMQLANMNESIKWPLLVFSKDRHDQLKLMGMAPNSGHPISISLTLSKTTYTTKGSLPAVKMLKQKHLRYHGLPEDRKTAAQGCILYDLLSSTKEAGSSSMQAQFVWDAPVSLLSSPTFASLATLKIHAVPGDPQSAAFKYHADLKLLEELLAFSESGMDGSQKWPCNARTSTTYTEFVAQLGSLPNQATMTATTTVSDEGDSPSQGGAAFGSELSQSLPSRTDLDFTERLWEYVKCSPNANALMSTISNVARDLRNGQIQPMMHKNNNKGMLAQLAMESLNMTRNMIKSSALHDSNFVALMESITASPQQIFASVVEIGIEKLRRDYMHHFLSQELAMWNQLSFYMEDLPLKGKIQRLVRLQNVLEMFVLVKSFSDIQHSTLRELVQAGLKFYLTHDSDVIPTMVQQLPMYSTSAAKVKRLCGSMIPALWSLALCSTDGEDNGEDEANQSNSSHNAISVLQMTPALGLPSLENVEDYVSENKSPDETPFFLFSGTAVRVY